MVGVILGTFDNDPKGLGEALIIDKSTSNDSVDDGIMLGRLLLG